MANSRIPGPLSMTFIRAHGKSNGASRMSTAGIRRGLFVWQTHRKDKPKKPRSHIDKITPSFGIFIRPWCSPEPGGTQGFDQESFIRHGSTLPMTRVSRTALVNGTTAGIHARVEHQPQNGGQRLRKSLQRKGAIVVYIGHSTLTKTPKGQPDGPSSRPKSCQPKKGA